MIDQARNTVRRAGLRRGLRAVADGRSGAIQFDLGAPGLDAVDVLADFTRPLRADSGQLLRLMAAFRNAGIADKAILGLSAPRPAARRDSARVLGALRLPQAVPWLEPLLRSKNRGVAEAGTKALGRIGGHRSSEALLTAIRRTGLRRSSITELARAAPDLFLEVRLSEPQHPNVKSGLAVAAGLRRRHTAVGPLLALLSEGSPRERAISCRALGWIGSPVAVPAVTAALGDPEWKVRLAATKALAALRARPAYFEVYSLLGDPSPRVRVAAKSTLRRVLRDGQTPLVDPFVVTGWR